MFNWKKMSLVLLAAVSLLSGCTKSNIVSPEGGTRADDGQPDTEIDKNIKIDWLEVREELRDQYLEPYGAFDLYVVCDDIDIADDRIAWDLIQKGTTTRTCIKSRKPFLFRFRRREILKRQNYAKNGFPKFATRHSAQTGKFRKPNA